MFDLFRSREKTVRYLLGAVLGLVALSMVITLIPGYGSGALTGGAGNDQIIAEIGGEALSIAEVRQVVSREMRSGRIPQGTESIFIPMLVQQMIAERAVAFQAQQMGFTPTEAELAEAISGLLPQLFPDGKFAGREAYASFLAQQNMTIAQFEANMRKQMASTKLETLALEGVVVTPSDVEEEFRRNNEQVKLAYFTMTPEKYRAQVTPTQAELEAAYESRKAGLKTPEKRTYLIFPIEEQRIAAGMEVSDEQLKQAYNLQLDRFRTPERVHVRHILLKTTDKSKEEIEKIRKQMESLLKQAKGGADFAELARKNSEDTGSAVKGGDLDWVTKGQTVPEFEKTAFSMKPGEISDIVTTMYGFHILKLEARETARVKPFEEVKAELKTETVRAQVFDRMQTLADQIHDALVRSPDEARKIALAAGITPIESQPISLGDPVPGVGANAQFNEAVSGIQKGGVAPVINVDGSRLAVVQVTDIIPPRQSTLAEVADGLRGELVNQKADRLLEEKVKEASEKLKAAKGDLASVARQMGFDVKTTDALTRAGNVEGLGAMVQLQEAYGKNPGEAFGPVRTPAGVAFVKVLEKIPADLTQLAAQRAQITESIKSRRAQERRSLFFDAVMNALTKQKKVKIYDDNIKRFAASFRG